MVFFWNFILKCISFTQKKCTHCSFICVHKILKVSKFPLFKLEKAQSGKCFIRWLLQWYYDIFFENVYWLAFRNSLFSSKFEFAGDLHRQACKTIEETIPHFVTITILQIYLCKYLMYLLMYKSLLLVK